MKMKTKQDYRMRRHWRVRRKVHGTAERPRMSVYVSNRHIYVQFIDDTAGATLAAASTLAAAAEQPLKLTVATARQIGQLAAQAALAKGIAQVVFDRGGFTYKARLKALADAARQAGLKF